MNNLDFKMFCILKLNRPLGIDELISPGEYEICTKSGEIYRFNFGKTEGFPNDNDKREIEFCCRDPYCSNKEFKITPDIIENISSINNFYLDADCLEDLKVVSIENMYFQFREPDKLIDKHIPDYIIEDYFKRNLELEEEMER